MPRRIVHQESSRSFLVLTMKNSYDINGYETEQSYVRLFDDQTFEVKREEDKWKEEDKWREY